MIKLTFCAILITAAISIVSGQVSNNFTVFLEGQPKASITTTKQDLDSAKIFKDSIERITNGSINLNAEDKETSKPSIEIGPTEYVRKSGLLRELEKLNDDAFIIFVSPGKLVITGKTTSGTMYGINYFLNNYIGLRQYHPDPLFHVIPSEKTILIPCSKKVEEPDYLLRTFSYGGFDEAGRQWWLYNGLHRSRSYEFHHNIYNLFTPEIRKQHPEWTTPGEKEKASWQVCYSNPGVVEFCYQAAVKAFSENPKLKAFSLGNNDGWGFCTCTECRKLMENEDKILQDRVGRANYGPAYFHFLNQIAVKLEKTHPGKMIGGMAYSVTEQPPKNFKLNDNILLLKTRYIAENTSEASFAVFDIWKGKVKHLGVYEYANPTLIPRFQLRRLQNLLRHQANTGGNFYYAEVYPKWEVEGPKYWIITRLLWDNNANIETLLDEYCRDLFGKAAIPMREYWGLCAKIWETESRKRMLSPWDDSVSLGRIIYPYIDRMKFLLDEAYKAAENTTIKKRIEYFKIPVEQRMDKIAKLGRIVDQFEHPITEPNCTGYMDVALKSLLEIVSISKEFSKLTKKVEGENSISENALSLIAGHTFLEMSFCLSNSLKKSGKTLDEDAFKNILENKISEAQKKWSANKFEMEKYALLREALKTRLYKIRSVPQIDKTLTQKNKYTIFYRKKKSLHDKCTYEDLNEIYFSYNNEKLFINIVSDEKEPSLHKEYARLDGPVYMGDAVTVVIVPKIGESYRITVDCKGNILDKKNRDKNWNAACESEIIFDREKGKLTFKLSIPFDSMGIQAEKMKVFGCNIIRHYCQDKIIIEDKGQSSLSWFKPDEEKKGEAYWYETGLLILE